MFVGYRMLNPWVSATWLVLDANNLKYKNMELCRRYKTRGRNNYVITVMATPILWLALITLQFRSTTTLTSPGYLSSVSIIFQHR